MLRISQIKLPIDHSKDAIKSYILNKLDLSINELNDICIVKKSLDARRNSPIHYVYSADVSIDNENYILNRFYRDKNVNKSPKIRYNLPFRAPKGFPLEGESRPVIVGSGPCGYFSALILAQMGFRPLLLERGKEVKERTFDTYNFWKRRTDLSVESNVQFGEGGAGTFSDGKLYSQKTDPNNYGRKLLEELVESGANPEILIEHRPHIGTFKLATVVRGLRSRIQSLGGEVRFQTRMDELLLEPVLSSKDSLKCFKVVGLRLADGSVISASKVILALGHSARDSFQMLERIGVKMEQKLFSVGLRIEHPQHLIDRDRWGDITKISQLRHAEYKLVYHAKNGRSVYSFCMCPGGMVVGSTSEKGCVVTNGMSQYGRSELNANSALVVSLERQDLIEYERWSGDPLAGLAFQRDLENKAFEMGGSDYSAPAQRLEDFMSNKESSYIGSLKPSYLPGIKLTDLSNSLPKPFIEAIREAIPFFSNKLSSYLYPDAIMTGVETRTSSPVRIIRDRDYESLNVIGLFPAGEGAGYAGGILSAGIDGIKVAEALAKSIINSSI